MTSKNHNFYYKFLKTTKMRFLLTFLICITLTSMVEALNGGRAIKSNWTEFMKVLEDGPCISTSGLYVLLSYKLQPGATLPNQVKMVVEFNQCLVNVPLTDFVADPANPNEYVYTYIPLGCTAGDENIVYNFTIENKGPGDIETGIFEPYEPEPHTPMVFFESGEKSICQSWAQTVGRVGTTDNPVAVNLDDTKLGSNGNYELNKASNTIHNFNAFPNPFTDHFQVDYKVTSSSFVSVELLDLTGKTVYQSVEKNVLEGNYNHMINGVNLPNGTYFCKIQTDLNTQVLKMVK